MKLVGSWAENKAEERKMLLNLRGMDLEEHKRLINAPTGMAFTRRIIALSAVFSLLILPKVAWLLSGEAIPISIPYTDESSKQVLYGLFTSTTTSEGFRTLVGIPIFEWDRHILTAIIGFYFGDRLAGKK